MSVSQSAEVENERMRWVRAAQWAAGRSLGPWGQLDEANATEGEIKQWRAECERIEALRDQLLREGLVDPPVSTSLPDGFDWYG